MNMRGRKQKSMAEQKETKQSTRTSTPGVEPSGRRSRGETGVATPPSRKEERNKDGADLGMGEERNGEDRRLKGEWEKTDGQSPQPWQSALSLGSYQR